MASVPVQTRLRLADLAIAGFAGFAFGVVLMHGLRPEYAPASTMISDYAVGPWGGVMTAAFLSCSLGCLVLAFCMARSRPASFAGWVAAVLLAVACIGLMVTARFPTDPPGAPSTPTGDIHNLSFLVNVLSLVISAGAVAILCWGDARWHPHRGRSVALALLLVVALIVQFKTLHRGMPYGLANRFFVVVLVSWLISTAWALRELGSRAPVRAGA